MKLVICSMAWLTNIPPLELADKAKEPDLATLGYWIERLSPLVEKAAEEVVVVIGNRCGEEEGEARYAGTSCVMGVGKGKLRLWGLMGRAEEGVCIVDTEEAPSWNIAVGAAL